MKTQIICLAFAATLASPAVSRAAIMDAGLHAYDLSTGYLWLDLTVSTNISKQTMELELAWGRFSDYRYATNAEVIDMWSRAGVSVSDYYIDDPGQAAAVQDLQSAFGITKRSAPGTYDLSRTQGFSADALSASSSYSPYLVYAEHISEEDDVQSWANFSELQNNTVAPDVGHWLIRASAPSPQSPLAASMTTGSPVELFQDIDLGGSDASLTFFVQFTTAHGSLKVYYGGDFVGAVEAPEAIQDQFVQALFVLPGPSYSGPQALRFVLDEDGAVGPANVLLTDISVPGLQNGGFAQGFDEWSIWGAGTVELADLRTPATSLDVDQNGIADALTDGLLLLRYLEGLRGTALTDSAIGEGCNECSPSEVEARLGLIAPSSIDVDGDASTLARTDGTLMLRYLFGFRGDTLVNDAVSTSCTRCDGAEVEAFLSNLSTP